MAGQGSHLVRKGDFRFTDSFLLYLVKVYREAACIRHFLRFQKPENMSDSCPQRNPRPVTETGYLLKWTCLGICAAETLIRELRNSERVWRRYPSILSFPNRLNLHQFCKASFSSIYINEFHSEVQHFSCVKPFQKDHLLKAWIKVLSSLLLS